MYNTFVESMWRGLQIGQQAESDRRLDIAAQKQAQVYQMQADEHQLKMAEYARGLQVQKDIQTLASQPDNPIAKMYGKEQAAAIAQNPALMSVFKPLETPKTHVLTPGAALVTPKEGGGYETLQGPPTKQEPFSLSPGQKRFDPAGNVIAEGGPKVNDPGNELELLREA